MDAHTHRLKTIQDRYTPSGSEATCRFSLGVASIVVWFREGFHTCTCTMKGKGVDLHLHLHTSTPLGDIPGPSYPDLLSWLDDSP